MGSLEKLLENATQWLVSPRRVLTDLVFLLFGISLFYLGIFDITCEAEVSGYLFCLPIRLLYLAIGIVCILFLSPEFIEGRIKTTIGRYIGIEPRRQRTSIADFDFDPSEHSFRETDEELEIEPVESSSKEFAPERDE